MRPLQPSFGGGGTDGFLVKLSSTGSALAYSTYIGGTGPDIVTGIAVDTTGSAYVTGSTSSTDFPVAAALQPFNAGASDVFIAKLRPDGSSWVYATYLGGTGTEGSSSVPGFNSPGIFGNAIAVDFSGNAYTIGSTSSRDFPTVSPFQSVLTGARDAFVVKVNAAGSALVYATYLGGQADDQGYGIAVDMSGAAWVTGVTYSTDFPTAEPFQPKLAGGADAFVARLAVTGSQLLYGTYLGGSGWDGAAVVGVDSQGNAYIAGCTESSDFPLVNPFQVKKGGDYDVFVAKFDPVARLLVYSTYLGGWDDEDVQGIAVETSGRVWIAGSTDSGNLPLVKSQRGEFSCMADGFVAAVDPSRAINCTYSVMLSRHLFGPEGGPVDLTVITPEGCLWYEDASTPPAGVSVAGTNLVRYVVSYTVGHAACPCAGIGPCTPSTTKTFIEKVAGQEHMITRIGFASVLPGPSSWGGETTVISSDHAVKPGGTMRVPIVLRLPNLVKLDTLRLTVSIDGAVDKLSFENDAGLPAPRSAQAVTTGRMELSWGGITPPLEGTVLLGTLLVGVPATATPGTYRATIRNGDVSGALGTANVSFYHDTHCNYRGSAVFTVRPTAQDNANLKPEVSRLSPSGVLPGGPDFILTVEGLYFVPSSVVRWNGADRPTKFISGMRLTASIPLSDIASAGQARVSVFTPPPGGGTSNAAGFTIDRRVGHVIYSGGAVNGASFAAGQPLTAGSIASVFGTGLANLTTVANSLPLPTVLGGVTVRFIRSLAEYGYGTAAPLFFVSPNQINLQVPWDFAGVAEAYVTVSVSGEIGGAVPISLGTFGPGIFAVNSAGTGQGAVLIARTGELAAVPGLLPGIASRPADRGEPVSLFCTGLGVVTNQPANGAAAPGRALAWTTALPSVSIGGIPAVVEFSGLAPGFVGLYQVNARVPADASPGSAVPVVLSIGGVTSNTVTIAVQ